LENHLPVLARRFLQGRLDESPTDDKIGRGLLSAFQICPAVLRNCGGPVKTVEVVKSVACARDGRVVFVLTSLNIGDHHEEERILWQQNERLVSVVHSGLEISQVKAAAGRPFIDLCKASRLGILVKKRLRKPKHLGWIVFSEDGDKRSPFRRILDLVGDGLRSTACRGKNGVNLLRG
jgi:hypothetical protein